jgi:hypothetical protein
VHATVTTPLPGTLRGSDGPFNYCLKHGCSGHTVIDDQGQEVNGPSVAEILERTSVKIEASRNLFTS